jgi:hypothetical protein
MKNKTIKPKRKLTIQPQVGSSPWMDSLRQYQKGLTDEQRLELWSEFQAGYCKHCGQEEGCQKCQCWNDE